jgi:hypothetical protein
LKIVAVVIALNALFALSSVGLVFSLARGSRIAAYAPVAALALWPAFMVTSQSVAGYLHAEYFSSAFAVVTIALGVLWTGWTLTRYPADYARMDWTTAATIATTALVGGLLVVWPHIWNNDFGYSEFANGEFLNYGQLAAFSLGSQTSPDPEVWERHHQLTRDGTDFINATIAMLTRQQPVHIVQLTAGLLRTAYLAGLMLFLRALLAGTARPVLATVAIGLVVVFSNLDIFQFEVSFMGAALGLGIAICAAGIVVAPTLPQFQFILLYVVLNIALLVSYPESMIVLKIVEILFVGEHMLRDRTSAVARRWFLGNLATIIVNPVLVFRKIVHAYAVTSAEGGWNVIAEPLTAPLAYVSRLAGISPMYQSDLALFSDQRLVVGFALTVLIIDLMFAVYLARRLKFYALLLIPVVVAIFHGLPYLGLRPHFYAAAKLLLAWSWILPLGLAACYASSGRLPRAALAILAGLFVTANFETMRRAKILLTELDTFKSASESRQVAEVIRAAAGTTTEVVLRSDDPVAGLYWYQVLDHHAITPRPTLAQAQYFARRGIEKPDSAYAVADQPRIVLKPNFTATWQMPNTDLRWVRLPIISAGRNLYDSRQLSISMEDGTGRPDVSTQVPLMVPAQASAIE